MIIYNKQYMVNINLIGKDYVRWQSDLEPQKKAYCLFVINPFTWSEKIYLIRRSLRNGAYLLPCPTWGRTCTRRGSGWTAPWRRPNSGPCTGTWSSHNSRSADSWWGDGVNVSRTGIQFLFEIYMNDMVYFVIRSMYCLHFISECNSKRV